MDDIYKLNHPNDFKKIITKAKYQILNEYEKTNKSDKLLFQMLSLVENIEDKVQKKDIKKGSKRIRVDLMEAFKDVALLYDKNLTEPLISKLHHILNPEYGIEIEIQNGYIHFNLPQ